jgi:hypothetical protein
MSSDESAPASDEERLVRTLVHELLWVMFGVNVILFFLMWGMAWGEDYTLDETFSAQLAVYQSVQITYLLWLGAYWICAFNTVILICTYMGNAEKGHMDKAYYHGFNIASLFYIAATLAKLLGLLFLYIYKVNVDSRSHDIAAGIGFGSAILCNFCLLIRRGLVYKYHKRGPRWTNTRMYWIIVFSIISFFVQISLAFSFLFTNDTSCKVENGCYRGLIEFFLSFFILFDFGWLILDFSTENLI